MTVTGEATPEIIGIAAVGRNQVIGAEGDIPWRIPQDWARFQRLTTGHVLVMGRKTYDSIGRPLPRRTTLVITRDARWRRDGVRAVPSMDAALEVARDLAAERVFVAGGGDIYRLAWDRLTALEITEVDLAPEGTVTFPAIDPRQWQEWAREQHSGYAFVSYRRLSATTRADRTATAAIERRFL